MGVDTRLLQGGLGARDEAGVAARAVTAAGEVLTPEAVADAVVAALAQERFLILPHPKWPFSPGSGPTTWIAGWPGCAAFRPSSSELSRGPPPRRPRQVRRRTDSLTASRSS